jgi:hypothetical protein
MKKALWILLALATACGDGGGPTSSNCLSVAGTWTGTFANSCNQRGTADVIVTQSGCDFTAGISGQGTVTGSISGASGSFTLTFAPPCSGTAAGTATVSANAVNGTYSGRAIGCCDPVSGSFTLTR